MRLAVTSLEKKARMAIPFFIFFSYFVLEFFIAYHQIFKAYKSDFPSHIEAIYKIGTLNFPQMGFEYTIFILSKMATISFEWMSVILLSIILGLQGAFTFFLLRKLTNIKSIHATFFTIIILTCGAIYLPFFNRPLTHVPQYIDTYLLTHSYPDVINTIIIMIGKILGFYTVFGVGSPNIWYSPNFPIIKLLGCLITYLYISFDSMRSTILLSLLLLISCFYKPNFAMIFIPAVIIFEFIKNKRLSGIIFINYKKLGLLLVPSIVLLFYMFIVLSLLYKTPDGKQSSIIFAPFSVIHLYVTNAFMAAVQALAFPVAVLLIRFKKILENNHYLVISWIMLLFGYLYWALLAQSGNYLYAAGNFGWCYNLGLALVFTFSIIEYVKFRAEALYQVKAVSHKLIFNLITFLLVLHFLSGLCYLLRIVFNILVY